MANYILKKIDLVSKKLRRYLGLDSIQQRDLSKIKIIIEVLLEKIQSLPGTQKDVVILEALYTSLFIKYRRCFNSCNRGAALGGDHIPEQYKDLHEYKLDKANNYYAHATIEQNEAADQIDSETNEVRGIATVIVDDLHQLNQNSLERLKSLIDILLLGIQDKKSQIELNK